MRISRRIRPKIALFERIRSSSSMTGIESLPPLMKTRKNQSTSPKNPSTTLHVVSSREAKPKGAADITSAASKLTPGLRLAERLRAARNERGFSLETMSQKSKVALRYVCMFEEGRYPMVADPAYLTCFV